jgi:hypothetical protein
MLYDKQPLNHKLVTDALSGKTVAAATNVNTWGYFLIILLFPTVIRASALPPNRTINTTIGWV